jgi:hypothetical protein
MKSDYIWDPVDLYSFNKRDLTEEPHEIIKYHNYVPSKLKHNESSITRIIFEHEKRNIIFPIDINHNEIREITYKDVIKMCETHNIEFKKSKLRCISSRDQESLL